MVFTTMIIYRNTQMSTAMMLMTVTMIIYTKLKCNINWQ